MNSKYFIALTADDSQFREGLFKLLNEQSNFQIMYSLSDGQELIDRISRGDQFPDVIILDLKMKPIDGIETTKILKNYYPECKIIILASYYDPRFIDYMLKIGVNTFLPKSIDPKELVFAINMVLEKGLYFTKEYADAFRVQNLQTPIESNINNSIELTKRELEILKLICLEKTTQQIADLLFITKRTVEAHKQQLLEKTGAKNTVGLIIYALLHNLVDIDNQLLNFSIPPSW